MSAHDHAEYTPGCFRCELSLDELDENQLRDALRVAYRALGSQGDFEALRAALAAERKLADRLADALDLELRCHFKCDACDAVDEGRDYEYRRSEGGWNAEYDPKTIAHDEKCPVRAALSAWREARKGTGA